MRDTIRKNDYFILVSSVLLSILAEIIFFQKEVGVGFLLFVSCFYIVFFLRFRLSAFHHRRIGLFLMAIIWILSATFLLFGKNYFYTINLVLIPCIMYIHIIVITRPNTFIWGTTKFIRTMYEKLVAAIQYDIRLIRRLFTYLKLKRLFVVSIVLLCIIGGFLLYEGHLISALRTILISLFIFGIFQVLRYQKEDEQQYIIVRKKLKYLHGPTILTLSVVLNILTILLFFLVQPNILALFIMTLLINLTMFIFFYFVLEKVRGETMWHRMSYTIFTLLNALFIFRMLQRLLSKTIDHYWTMQKMIAYIVLFYILFLCIYTLVRIWANRISLTHFYFIIGLLFYTILNVLNIEQFVVKSYETHGVLEERNLQQLSYSGWIYLMELYDQGEDVYVDQFLNERVMEAHQEGQSLLSYNFSQENFINMYELWEIDNGKEEEHE